MTTTLHRHPDGTFTVTLTTAEGTKTLPFDHFSLEPYRSALDFMAKLANETNAGAITVQPCNPYSFTEFPSEYLVSDQVND